VSWSPISQESLNFIIENAINTTNITISLSPYTYYGLSEETKTLATQKNITLELITTNASDDSRLKMLKMNGDGASFLANDGTYKPIDLSNYITVEEAEEMINNIVTKILDNFDQGTY
jgi:hypothetical protein